jgi:hypothetical protein
MGAFIGGSVTAAGTAGSRAAAARGCPGGFGLCLAAATFGNESTWGHQFGYVFALTGRTIRFFIAKDKAFKILVAFFTMVFINRHI